MSVVSKVPLPSWRDGTVRWIWVKGRGFFDQQGRLLKISGIAMDIDERKRAEERLRLLAAALEEAANAVVLTDSQGTILWVNSAFTQMTGYTAAEAMGKDPSLWRSDKQDAAFYEALWNTIAAGTVWRGEVVNRKKDGSLYTEEMTVAPVRSAAGAISHYVAIKQDITPRKLAEQALRNAEQKYRSIFENAVLGIFQTNAEGEFLRVNPALARLAGYDSPEDFLNNVHGAGEIYVDLKRRDELRELVLAQKVVRDFEVEFKTKDGGTRTTSINVGAMADSAGTSICLEGTVQDISERKAAEARVQFLAYHDDLTGLPNRVLFEDRLAKALANARRREERVAVLWLDLDNFKTINDSLGHTVGDLLLKQVGERLHQHTRAQDTVAKVGGDEFIFALINPGPSSRAAAAYSSLSYLQDLPVCKLKIDRSFVNAMTLNPRDAAIIAAVISMGNSLNLKVLAEGVETEEQMSFLRNHHCDEIQGFYFSQPLEADAFAEKVRASWRQPDLPRFAPELLPAPALAPLDHEDVLRSSR